MGSVLEIGIKIRRVVFIAIKGVYRSACHHPFLVGFFCFLLLLYKSSPFLFSVLVSSSPVLVCTAVLLGTLLSFGQPNVPEVEKEEKVTHDISSFQTGFSESETVVADRDESYFVKGYSDHRSDVEESGNEEVSLLGKKDNRAEEDRALLSELEDENSQDIHLEKQVKGEVEREFPSIELGKKKEVHEESLRSEGVSSDEDAIEKQYVMVQKVDDDIIEIEHDKTSGDAFDSFKGGHEDGSPSSSWKQVENDNDEDEDESVESSGSDRAESSSPDASMADIIPMLDELDPLLDQDAPQPAHLSRDDSDAASEKSQKSDDDGVESDEDTENRCEAEDGADERDDEEEEEMEGGKEDESKCAIKWTEDDQKNLMDLGSLELERNQRLENLIARRRARRLMTEKNLIDLDCADLPCNVAPIAIRRNPFDFPDESYADMGLPPIPGSAPSILQPRRNPFDIPYDSNEEKPDLKGDSFQHEFTQFNQKDAIFRRHESFSMGPSVLGMSKHERHDINWKPIFISERMATEGTSYSPFQRQSSEVSDSKLSSVPDTESVSSIDQDERKFSEQDLSQETELISNTDHASDDAEHGSESSGENDSVEMIQTEESNVRHDEVEIVLGGGEDPSEMELYPETGEVEITEQFNAGETHLRREPSDERSHSSRSSHSSLSEVIDNIPDEAMEKTADLQQSSQSSLSEVVDYIPDEKMRESENLQQEDGHHRESGISTQTSVEESNFQHVSDEMVDSQPVEPVYDSSPSTCDKLQSFPSVSSDSATEFSERALPPVSAQSTTDLADEESEHDHRLEDNTSGHEKSQAASSELHVEVKKELRSGKSEDNQQNVTADEVSGVVPNFVDQNESTKAEFLDASVSVDSSLSSDVSNSGLVHGQGLSYHASTASEMLPQDNVDSPDSNHQMASEKSNQSEIESMEQGALHNDVSRFDNADMSKSVQDDEMLDVLVSEVHHISSNSSSVAPAQDLQLSEETEHVKKKSSNKDNIYPIEQDEVFFSSSMEQGDTDIHQDLDKKMVSSASDCQDEIDAKFPSNLHNHLSSSAKVVVTRSSNDHDKNKNSDATQVELAQGVGTSNDGIEELHDAIDKSPQNISSATSEKSLTPEFSSPTGEMDLEFNIHGEVVNEGQKTLENPVPSAEGYTFQDTERNIDESDDIKEIDEEFLSELDTVGDFSISDTGVTLHTHLEHEKTGDAQLSSLPKDVKIAEGEQDVPVLEARSLEDINLAFKQLQEGADVREVILSSTIKDQLDGEEFKDHPEVNSDIQVIEARSLEDINVALKQISKDNQGELPEPMDLKDTSVKTDANEVGLVKVSESSDIATSAEEVSRTPVDESENEPISSFSKKEKSSAEEVSRTPVDDELENEPIGSSSNKEKSHSRKSSSSSSSSSSDSD